MKKHYILFILFVLFNLNIVYAAIEVKYKCHDERCIEGSLIDYSVVVYNNLNYTVWIDNVYIKDVEYDKIIALDIGKLTKLEPGELEYFNFTSEITAPVEGYTFSIVPCFEAKRKDQWNQTVSREVCSNFITKLTVLPLSKIECEEDSDCKDYEFCSTNKCVNVYCEEGKVARNHECVEANCNFFQKIQDNECVFNKNKTSVTLFVVGVLLLFIYFSSRKK